MLGAVAEPQSPDGGSEHEAFAPTLHQRRGRAAAPIAPPPPFADVRLSPTLPEPTSVGESEAVVTPSDAGETARPQSVADMFIPAAVAGLCVVFFLRMGVLVSFAGVWLGVGIVLLAAAIALLTARSLAAIAKGSPGRSTNLHAMLERGLGPESGGTIGCLLYLAHTLGLSFYVLASIEATLAIGARVLHPSTMAAIQAFGLAKLACTAVVAALLASTARSVSLVALAQRIALAALVVAVLISLVSNMTGFDGARLVENAHPAFLGSFDFGTAFAVFFPAAVGLTFGMGSVQRSEWAGSAHSGARMAIASLAGVHVIQLLVVAGAADRALLEAGTSTHLEIPSLLGPVVVVAVLVATWTSALSCLWVATQLLQGLGRDRVLRPLASFGRATANSRRPSRAATMTCLLALAPIWIGDLDFAAQFFSMFVLVAWTAIHAAVFVESGRSRPRVLRAHGSTALLGAVACALLLLAIDVGFAILSGLATAVLYLGLRRRDLELRWGSPRRGAILRRLHEDLHFLRENPPLPRQWRPVLATVGPDLLRDSALNRIGAWFEAAGGPHTATEIHASTEVSLAARVDFRKRRLDDLRRQLGLDGVAALPEVLVVDDYIQGLAAFLQTHAVGGLQPNTILLSFPSLQDREARDRTVRTVGVLRACDLNLLLVRPVDGPRNGPKPVIDLWWRGARNGSLMAMLATYVLQDHRWQDAKLRIFRAVPHAAEESEARHHLSRLMLRADLDAEIHVFTTRDAPKEFIPRHSGGIADLVMLGIGTRDLNACAEYLRVMEPLLSRLPTTLLVGSCGDADLFEEEPSPTG